jgi:hypothetical protein
MVALIISCVALGMAISAYIVVLSIRNRYR